MICKLLQFAILDHPSKKIAPAIFRNGFAFLKRVSFIA